MKKNIREMKWFIPGIILGAIAGYIYYYFWGCDGTCLITSSPVKSTIYGAFMGGLLNNMFKPAKKETNTTANPRAEN
jgi:hypothetical protein